MGGVYLTGPSGTGKTSFCRVNRNNYGFGAITNTLTSMIDKHPGIKDLDYYERQIVFLVELLKQHHIQNINFLADRSVLDVLAWSDVQADLVNYLGLYQKVPDLIIVIPTPPYNWYKHHYEEVVRSRLKYYLEKLNIDSAQKFDEPNSIQLMYDTERTHHKVIMKMLEELQWPYYIPEYSFNPEGFRTSWQKDAEKKVLEVWGIDRQCENSTDPITNEERDAIRVTLDALRAPDEKAEEMEDDGTDSCGVAYRTDIDTDAADTDLTESIS